MKSTLDVALEHYQPLSKIVGGNFEDSTDMLKKALSSNNVPDAIESIVKKHYSNSKIVGGNFQSFLKILKKFID